ncbi:MAG: histone deacetylase family protein [Planctomycetes bacterium]|nr:histone deacetylase family protein [Planctomycetota bacterium]
MFSIRRIYDAVLPVNQAALREVRQIFREQFPAAPAGDIEQLAEKLKNPFPQRLRTVLYVAEKARRNVTGFATVLHEPEIGFCYLDYMAAAKTVKGRGVGAALYEHVRDEAVGLGAKGLFFECLPDEPAGNGRLQAAPGENERPEENSAAAQPSQPAEAGHYERDDVIIQQNAARLKFYERYGARPIVGVAYDTPIPGVEARYLPYLVYDDLDRGRPLRAHLLRQVVRAILERKYGHICPPEYVEKVVQSIREDPVRLREFRYVKKPKHKPAGRPRDEPVAVAINDRHTIHHVRERGYVESPVRIGAIRSALEGAGLLEVLRVNEYPMEHVLAVHDAALVEYLKRACENAPAGKSVYPYVFPIRNATRPPRELSVLAGYYCIDTFTPIHANAFAAAKRGVDCALSAADEVLSGRRIAYALVRPPGHHAERRSFGGFCYFNNCAVAAHYLSRHGTVAILDVDYHHGNGQQDIFYERSDVLTVSIHGDPDFAYPYFTGFADERGAGAGEHYNLNIPLPEVQDGAQYREALHKALDAIRGFGPAFLVVALGLDPAKGDPTGTWSLTAKDFERNGRLLGELHLPTLVIQEGGYRTRTLGTNARNFFRGLVRTADGG